MRKILIIDDETPTLSMFQLFLSAYGYRVLTAENGEKGIHLFEQEHPQIVLTDIKMPGLDGLTVIEKIKAIDATAQIIVLTGHGDMDLEKQAMDRNATAFIHKPIQKEALDAALNKAEENLKQF